MKGKTAAYLHLGGNRICFIHEIIAVINTEERIFPDTADLMDKAEAEGRFYETETGWKMKSLVVTSGGLYASPISSATLYKRAVNGSRERKEGKNE